MVSTRSSITPSEASTSRSANGGTADNLSSTPSGAGGIVDAAARGSSEPAYSPTGLLSLSNELLARIWDIAHTNPYQDWPFSAILVNRQIYRAVLPVWWQRFYLEEAATFDRQAAALSRHPHQRRLVKHLSVRIACIGPPPPPPPPPLRFAVAAIGQLLRPKTLVLDADGDPTSHPFDEYLLDISCIPTLQELTVTVQTEAPITRPPPSFPALRKLRIFNSQLATWILEGSNPALDALELIVHEDQPYHAYPGRLFDTYTSSCGIRALSRPARSWVAWNAPMTMVKWSAPILPASVSV
ncbi:hypothetical protein AAT19DRAFT_14524 [Rhodotorula toruloides]|uniref:F-box domain-containing protein n=1 Tax=Rhodotorula toruloides TaxID=5286 RepID=A0A2T0A813_RHOTO|nr:hypothetical protein AAT19DRAFT_14524 [Rhodotorula toruloides]